MAQFPLLWIERRSYSSFARIRSLCFDADYDKWLEDYSRTVMELHEQRHAILPVEFDGQEFEAYCSRTASLPIPILWHVTRDFALRAIWTFPALSWAADHDSSSERDDADRA